MDTDPRGNKSMVVPCSTQSFCALIVFCSLLVTSLLSGVIVLRAFFRVLPLACCPSSLSGLSGFWRYTLSVTPLLLFFALRPPSTRAYPPLVYPALLFILISLSPPSPQNCTPGIFSRGAVGGEGA